MNQYTTSQFTRVTGFAALVVALALLLHACGFQLRGAVNLSQEMSPVYIEKNEAFDLAREIKDALTSNDVKTVDVAEQSKSQLILLSEAKTRRVLSVDGTGRAKEYLLMYSVNFEIKRKLSTDGKTESKRDSVSMSRALLFEPDAVLAVVNESEVIYQDMQRDAARLILLKLQSFSSQISKAEKPAGENSDNTSGQPAGSAPAEAVGSQSQ